MGRRLGMDPERVRDLGGRLRASVGVLEGASATADRAAAASLDPLSWGVQPGGIVLAPWSIAGTQIAAAQVRAAGAAVEELVGRLFAEAAQQLAASIDEGAAGAGRGRPAPEDAEALLVAALGTGTQPYSAAEVARLWAALSDAERRALIEEYADRLGGLAGVPYADRDAANRLVLDRLLEDPGVPGSQRDALAAVRAALDEAAALGTTVQLVTLDFPEGADPRAAIAFGDLDEAEYVGMVVPGMDNTVTKDMSKLTTAAYNLYEEQGALAGPDSSRATIAWMGYQTPGAVPNLAVLGEGRAKDGAGYLTSELGGLHATGPDDRRVTVFAHSYGTRTATYSLSEGGSADALVMFGSPGVAEPVTSAADLDVPAGEVYATRAEADGVAPIGLFGSGNLDPLDAGFGAEVFSSDGRPGYDSVDDHGMLLADESNGEKQGYLDRGSDSLHDMALIGIGRGGEVR